MTFLQILAVVVLLVVPVLGDLPGQDASASGLKLTQVKPVALEVLLGVLPESPENWAMRKSQARTVYQGNLEAYAMREFEELPPIDDNGANSAEFEPEKVIVAIRDTCGIGPRIELFQEENAPLPGGDFQMGKWKRYPGMMVRMGKDRRALRILVEDRFVLEVIFSGNNYRALNKWLGECRLQSLIENKQANQVTIFRRVRLQFLDEINPGRNRDYTVPIESNQPDDPLPGKDSTIPEKAEPEVNDLPP